MHSSTVNSLKNNVFSQHLYECSEDDARRGPSAGARTGAIAALEGSPASFVRRRPPIDRRPRRSPGVDAPFMIR
jgi:hypothetical protein